MSSFLNNFSSFVFGDNVTIYGHSQEEYNKNLKEFLEAAKADNLVFNKNKYIYLPKLFPMSRMWYNIYLKAEYKWFEFRDFFLLD